MKARTLKYKISDSVRIAIVGTMIALSGAMISVAYGICGDGKLEQGEGCDLGTRNNGVAGSGVSTSGCYTDCTIAADAGWQCNDQGLGYTGYMQMKNEMEALYDQLAKAVDTTKTDGSFLFTAGTDCSIATNAGSNFAVQPGGAMPIDGCNSYRGAITRLKSYLASNGGLCVSKAATPVGNILDFDTRTAIAIGTNPDC